MCVGDCLSSVCVLVNVSPVSVWVCVLMKSPVCGEDCLSVSNVDIACVGDPSVCEREI